jgi:hypothetical protein
MEIEEYHRTNYLVNDWWHIAINAYGDDDYHDIKKVRLRNGQTITQIDTPGDCSHMTIIPGSNWQMMRFDNISYYSKVCIPGLCINCRSEQSFTVDILDYLYSIISMLKVEPPFGIVRTDCDKCNVKNQVLSFVIRFPDAVIAPLIKEYKTRNSKK